MMSSERYTRQSGRKLERATVIPIGPATSEKIPATPGTVKRPTAAQSGMTARNAW
jgi:hypothetical protein